MGCTASVYAAGTEFANDINIETELRTEFEKQHCPNIVDKCRELDEGLAVTFREGHIRLLRRAWLLEARDQRLPYRQVLEARQLQGESPLLDPKEAVDLLERGDRSIGALTHPWYSPGDPDPAGVKLKILREALKIHTHIEAVFVDYASLFQHPPKGKRTDAENEAFERALGVMGDVYASAVGTTVLQIKEIPPRPPEFDGELCLFGLKAGVGEAAVREALCRFGEIESCDLAFESSYGIVRFTTHAAALQAKAANGLSELCSGVDTRYNERSYDGRGCVYPRMKTELDKLPPKLISLASGRAPEPVELTRSDVWQRVQRVIGTIEQATFTGKGDKEKVPKLYTSYVGRVANVLTSTLALQTTLETAAEVPPMPSVDAPPADALRLAEGQLLLLPPGADARLAGGDGAWLAEVEASERATRNLFDGGVAELTFDGHSHALIPWRPAEAGAEASLRRELPALRALGERVQRLLKEVRQSEGELQKRGEASLVVVADAAKLPVVAEVARQAEMAIREVLKKDADYLPVAPQLKERIQSLLASLRRLSPEALKALAVAAWREGGMVGARRFASGQRLVVRATDGAWREAAAEEACTLDGGPASLHPWNHAPLEMPLDAFEALRAWHTTVLRAQHSHIADALSGRRLNALEQCVAIEVAGGGAELAAVVDARSLATWLHKLHEERLAGEEAARPPATLLTAGPASGKTTLLSQVVVLSLDSELVPILIKVQFLQQRLISSPNAFAPVWNWVDAYLRLEHGEASPLYRMLRQAMMARRALLLLDGLDEGGEKREEIERHVVEVLAPQGHVLLATSRPAGIGEARFTSFHRLSLSPLTPEQQEHMVVRRVGEAQAGPLLEYVRDRVPIDTETAQRVTANPLMLSMVASVFELRSGLPMPTTVAELYEVATDVMLSRGGAALGALRRLLQAIFFEAQVAQRRVIEDRQLNEAALGLERPEELEAIRKRAAASPLPPFDGRAEMGHVVEVLHGEHSGKRGVIVTDEVADKAKVTFADGKTSSWLSPYQLRYELRSSGLDETAFLGRAMAARAAEVRSACGQLPAAMRDALAEVRGRVARDELPLLSLLQAKPLQLQSSHLSFQEYFAARALCEEGTRLSGAPPWQWPAGWANALALGAEMGEPFAKGLKRAAGVEADFLDLTGKLGGDPPTVMRAVALFSEVLTDLNLSDNKICDVGAAVIAEALRGNEVQLTTLDLSRNGIEDAGAVALASALRVNGVLKTLDLYFNQIGPEGGVAIGKALAVNEVLRSLNLSVNRIGREGGVAIGEALKVNEVTTLVNLDGHELDLPKLRGTDPVTSLDLSSKGLGPASAIVIASLIVGNAVLTKLNLDGHELDLPKLRGTDPMTSLDLSNKGLGPASAIVIASLIAGNGVLTNLSLFGNGIGDEGAKALASTLRVNEVLTDLNLRGNGIGPGGAKAIGKALAVNGGVLTSLDVGFNSLTEESALGIVRVERQRNKLTSLGLARCNIGPTGAAEIAEYVSGSAVLTELRLDKNEIGDEGATALASALEVNEVLKTLSISRNDIGPEGGVAIGEALRGNEVLTSLDVGGARPEEAALSIVRVERQRNRLTSLGLALCNIGPTGAAEIAEYVSGSAVLKTLYLNSNEIGTKGAKALASALRVNTVLTNLLLWDNDIGEEGAKALASALRVNEVLTKLIDGPVLENPVHA